MTGRAALAPLPPVRAPLRRWAFVIVLAVVCVAFGLLGETGRALGRYEREMLELGEWWRLATAHLVHLGPAHLAMNLVALALIGALFDDVLSAGEWTAAAVASAAAIDAGLWVFAPPVGWYVGLSGVLHGLFAYGALKLALRGAPAGWLLAAGLGAKLAWEHWAGAVPFSAATAGGPVVVEAHLFGALGGALALAAGAAVRGLRGAPL
ncbi:MAG TPA: rhombosortase [Gammaproteobacteria bacterium]